MNSAREIDLNGYVNVPANPISRSGIFQYKGRSIDKNAEPDTIYNVYRPASELSDPDAIDSFKLVPLIDDHTMLGGVKSEHTAPEEKGVHGVTGQDVEFKEGVLYANLKIFSQTLYDMVQQGKNNLSLGYRCVYEKTAGMFEGEPYQYIQRKLRGNHLALVDEARCAVAVLDHHITFDHFDLTINKGAYDMSEEEKKAAADKAAKDAKDAAEMKEKEAADKKAADEKEAKEAADAEEKMKCEKEAADKKAKDEEEAKEKKDGMDAAELKSLRAKVDNLEKDGMRSLVSQIKARDVLAGDLSNVVGTFDHSEMTVDDVAAYGVKALKLDCDKGSERATLAGYLQGSKKSTVGMGFDAKPKSSEIDAYLNA